MYEAKIDRITRKKVEKSTITVGDLNALLWVTDRAVKTSEDKHV